MPKRSRLEVKKPPNHWKSGQFVWFFKQNDCHSPSKTGHKLCPKNDHSKTGHSGFWMFSVIINGKKTQVCRTHVYIHLCLDKVMENKPELKFCTSMFLMMVFVATHGSENVDGPWDRYCEHSRPVN
jgi:hypothetical protein